MSSSPVLLAEDVRKVFQLPRERRNRLKEHLVHLFRPVGYDEFEALRGVSLSVSRGEFFSIVGHNGSGKSTLLKVLAGIYRPTSGRVQVDGRLSPFIELGVGFNPELSARDNVYLNGTILGLDRRQIAKQFDEIIGFAELEKFVDLKLKNFSSGMMVRLAFSVAIRAHADILLIDEVLAVGDANFQAKCFDVFRRMRAEEKTIVFVSHDLGSVKEFSDRVMVLDHGEVVGVYGAAAGIVQYQRLNEERANRELERAAAGQVNPNGHDRQKPSLRGVELLGQNGEPTRVIHRGDDVRVVLTIDNPTDLPLNAGVSICRSDGFYCFGTNTFLSKSPPARGEEVEIAVTFENVPLQRGSYQLLVGVMGESSNIFYEFKEHMCDFQVVQWDEYEGLLYVDHTWETASLGGTADAGRDHRPRP
jgi:ABC-type polysaccharide/polyol phosphate transport system ATPase subunit